MLMKNLYTYDAMPPPFGFVKEASPQRTKFLAPPLRVDALGYRTGKSDTPLYEA